MEKYIIICENMGLHYIQGSLFYRDLDTAQDVDECTTFYTKKEAIAFLDRLPEGHSVFTISYGEGK